MEAPLSSTSASVATAESERVCWLCLCGSEAGPLTLPCKCPSMYSHPACLGRWQLQSAGKEEERFCRFCHTSLPGWTQSLLDDPVAQPQKPAVPVMAVVFNGRVVKLPCTPGKEGAELFKKQIREIFQLDDTVSLDVTFELKVPAAKEQNRPNPTDQKVYLKGFHTFEAASKVAAICAAKRMARKSSKSNSGDSLLRSTSTGLSDTSSSGSSSSSSNAAGSGAASVHRHVQRISAPPMVAVSSSSPSLPSAPPPSPTAHSASTSPGASAFSAASTSPCPASSEPTRSARQQQRSAVRSSSATLPPLSVLNYAGSTSLSDPEPHPSYSLESRQLSLSPRNSISDQQSAQAPPAGQTEVAAASKPVSKSLSKRIVQRLKSLFD